MSRSPIATRIRITVVLATALSLFGLLTLRLYYLQVLAFDNYVAAAEQNRVRFVPIEPTRGRILDRNGVVLVDNRPSNIVGVRLEDLRDRAGTVARLSEVLGVPADQIDAKLDDKRFLPYAPIPIAADVSKESIVYLMEHQELFPGVEAIKGSERIYPNHPLAPHLLGYIGEITAEQLQQEAYQTPYRYRMGAIVGRTGIEYAYESDLRGTDGLIQQPVDVTGKVIGEPLNTTEPIPGYDVVTTIDARIQAVVEESLALGIARARATFDQERRKNFLAPGGAAVVLDPRNGEVLAMDSFPHYDLSAFIGGISAAEFDALIDHPANPLLNRAIQAEFPPGSTFKVVTAAAALNEGIASRGGRYGCPASVRLFNQTFRNWRSVDSGALTVAQALGDSCNTVFQNFGAEFWRRFRAGQGELLQEHARAFGFGDRSGIDLPFEKPGRVPDEVWLKRIHQRLPEAFPYSEWLPGYTINMAFGQGDLNVTPLQMANGYAAIANGGAVFRPRVGLRIMDGEKVVREIQTEEAGKLPVSSADLQAIRQGLEMVVTQGTGRSVFAGFPHSSIRVAGKTGSAQLQTIPPKQPFSWFAAYAPAHDPRFVVAVMVEEAGAGSQTAGPITRRIMDGLFRLPLGDVNPGPRTD